MKLCRGPCMLSRPLSDFGKDSKMRDGHRSTCKSCRSKRSKALKLIGCGVRPIEEVKAIAYLAGVLRRAHQKPEYDIPVRLKGSPEPFLEYGCLVRMQNNMKMVIMRTLMGPVSWPFSLLNPERLVDLLKLNDMIVVVPERIEHG